jgi:hypothetical protein
MWNHDHCPNCKTEIKLTESLSAPLIEPRGAITSSALRRRIDVSKRGGAVQGEESLDGRSPRN